MDSLRGIERSERVFHAGRHPTAARRAATRAPNAGCYITQIMRAKPNSDAGAQAERAPILRERGRGAPAALRIILRYVCPAGRRRRQAAAAGLISATIKPPQ